MWSELRSGLKGLVGSKKFLAAIISCVVWIGGRFGAELDAEELLPAVAPLWGYILAQMGADWGKSVGLLSGGGKGKDGSGGSE